jgi:hypothetical protein
MRFFFRSRGKRTLPLMTLIQKKRRIQCCVGMGCNTMSSKKMGGIAAAPNLWREKGDPFLVWCLLCWFCVLLHAFLPALLAFLHELLRLLPLLRSEYGKNL